MKGLAGLAMKTNCKIDEESRRSSGNDNSKPSQECRSTARTQGGLFYPTTIQTLANATRGDKPKPQRPKK